MKPISYFPGMSEEKSYHFGMAKEKFTVLLEIIILHTGKYLLVHTLIIATEGKRKTKGSNNFLDLVT